MADGELRLLDLLRGEPGTSSRNHEHPAAVSEERGLPVRSGDRLQGLARPDGSPLSCTQAVVGAAIVRRRGPADLHSPSYLPWPEPGPAHRRRSPTRAGCPHTVLAGVGPSRRRQRGHRDTRLRHQLQRDRVPDHVKAWRGLVHPDIDRPRPTRHRSTSSDCGSSSTTWRLAEATRGSSILSGGGRATRAS